MLLVISVLSSITQLQGNDGAIRAICQPVARHCRREVGDRRCEEQSTDLLVAKLQER